MPSIIDKAREHYVAFAVAVLTILLYQLSFPPFHLPEAAYFFAVPYLLWATQSTTSKNVLRLVALASSWISWVILIFWLRHVTWTGMLVLSAILAIFLGGWLIIAGNILKNIQAKSGAIKLFGVIALAALWVSIEWLKTFLFSGFPWLPLAASQWERPALLQILSWTGSFGLSFIIVFINLGITQYGLQLYRRIKSGQKASRFSCLEFYVSLAMLIGVLFIYVRQTPSLKNQELAFKVGIAQPYIPGLLKWDRAAFEKNLLILEKQTMELKSANPDILIWPETAVPASLNKAWGAKHWIEALIAGAETPLLTGGLMHSGENVYTALVEVSPNDGVNESYYAKRKLVPFGEYVPLRKWIPFINKVIPVSFDVLKGNSPAPLTISVRNKDWNIGGLICYEDIFPSLARETSLLGAEIFVMVTNNAWYGEEAGAYQHAAHSVLRAVETRRPVIRCGNGGWSGWIDEYGHIRKVVTNDQGTVYFRGTSSFDVYRDKTFIDNLSFYVKHGNWFAWMCIPFAISLSLFYQRKK